MDRDGPAPAHLPPATDRLAPHHPPGCRGSGAGLARGGLSGPHLLGRAVHLPVPELPATDPGRRVAGLPPRPPRRGPGGGPGGRLPRGDVPLAERLQRAGGDPDAASQPEVGSLATGPLSQPAARQHRHRLQRLAALHGHREHRIPSLCRRRAADRDRPLLGQPGHLQRRGGSLRGPRRDGPRRVPRGLPGLRRAGPAQQHLHECDGGLGATAGPGGAGGPAAALPPGAGRGARDPRRRAGALARDDPQDEGRVPRRRGALAVRGLRVPPASSTGRATGSATATSDGWTGCWRPRATAPTATSWPSRPTC